MASADLTSARTDVTVNGRSYGLPRSPVVVVCFDGADPAYLDAAVARGRAPAIAAMREHGFAAMAAAAMPTFTNPNNVSIVTGVPPAVHGVAGNYVLDRATGEARMVLDAGPMRADTVPAALACLGVPVAVVTAKRKLLAALARGLDGIAVSAEDGTEAWGQVDPGAAAPPAPERYGPALSLFVLAAGQRILERGAAQVLYLSLSDTVQHSHAPDEPEALDFVAAVDSHLGALAGRALVAVTADHGMSDMADPDGAARVVFIGDALDAAFGAGAARVICPITDPFVRHHAALGGFVRVYLAAGGPDAATAAARLAALTGVEAVLPGPEAAARFAMPADSEADLVVLGAKGVALGDRAAEHDLSQLAGRRLRSHGGLHERAVPMLLSRPLAPGAVVPDPLHNYDVFHLALNGVLP